MRFRIEVAKGRNLAWRWFLRVAKKHPGHSVKREGPFCVHTIETTDRDTILAFWSMIRPWKNLSTYIDDQLVSPTRFGLILFQGDRTKRMLAGIIDKKAREREQNEAQWRRDMGLGPDSPS